MSAAKEQQQASVETAPAALDATLGAALRVPGDATDRTFSAARKSLLGATFPEVSLGSVRALIHLVEYETGAGKLDLAAQAASRALSVAEKIGDPRVLRHASSVKGIIACETADLTGSIRNFYDAMGYAVQAGDRRGEVVAWVNLASPYLEANLEAWSLACGRRGLDLMDTVPEGDDAAMFHGLFSTLNSNVAGAALRMEEYRTGLRAVQRAERHLSRFPASSVNELIGATETHTNYARLLTALNLLDSAETQVALAAGYAERSGRKQAIVAAELARGLLEVKRGLTDRGLKRLHDAAGMCKDHRAVSQSLRALAEAHIMAGVPEGALSFYGDLAGHIRRWHREGIARCVAAEAASKSRGASVSDFAFDCVDELVTLSELREDATGAHPQRIGRLAFHLARAAGESESQSQAIERGARVHDIGKVGLMSEILLKRDELDAGQRKLVQEHSQGGEELIPESVADFGTVAAAVRWHHERFDGAGYPDGLKGEAIPLAGRVVAIADSFDSLTHSRTRREALTADQAMREMENMPGQPFDPALLSSFRKVIEDLGKSGGTLDRKLQSEARESKFLAAHQRIEEALRGVKREGLPPSLQGT
jgi:HD-GYP domain-containing protein (c-di-GMP phosphodiesterase class II)